MTSAALGKLGLDNNRSGVGLCCPSQSAAALELVRAADGVYALVGDLGQRSPDNLGSNSTHGFIVTPDGVVVIDRSLR